MKLGWSLRRVPALAYLVVCLAILLSGCATPQMASLQQRWPEQLPGSALISKVPFYAQQDYQCGPAALAMAAGAAGIPLHPDSLVDQVYLPERKGSLQIEMLATGRKYGLLSYQLKPDIEYLLQEVAAGHPVIVLQNLSFSFSPVWHYAVAIGFDRKRNTLILHSGRTERLEMSLYTFERTWARAGNWAMLLLPPTKMPATAEPHAYATAAAALERTALSAAEQAYATALQQWPEHSALLLGAGNTAYKKGQISAATASYQKLVHLHPDFADGWHNLAQALFDQGKVNEAAVAIGRAVTVGGPRLARYKGLQQQIHARLASSAVVSRASQ